MDVQAHLPLAPRDLLILSVLAEGPLHGYGLIKAVERRSRSGVLLDPANLYRVLRRMSGLAWIAQAEDSPESRRRTYRVTAEGPRRSESRDREAVWRASPEIPVPTVRSMGASQVLGATTRRGGSSM